jgi:4-amino-4-deoxy-L-arabinose transferase-like glycosyltransferase
VRSAGLLWLVLAAGAIPRVAAVLTVGDVREPHGDEGYYLAAAQSLVRGEGHPGSMRPPGYPVFLAAASRVSDGSLTALRLAQVPLSLLSIALVFSLVARRFGAEAAAVSGLFMAWSPDLVHYTHYLWAETLFTTLLLSALWTADRARGGGGPWLVLAGAALAASALIREMALYLLPGMAYWLTRGTHPRSLRPAVLVVLAVLGCLLPWTIRNYRLHGHIVPISSNRWYPVAEGNLLPDSDPARAARRVRELRQRYYGNPDEISREEEARTVALHAIAEQQPAWLLRKIVWNTCLLFAPSRSQLARYVMEGWLQPRWRPAAVALVRGEAFLYGFSMLVGVTALWLVPDAPFKWLVVSVLVVFVAIYTVGNASHRFRAPMVPLFVLYAGPLLRGHGVRSRPRLVGAALTVAAFLGVVAADLLGFPVVFANQY